jgi:hypothetical protein
MKFLIAFVITIALVVVAIFVVPHKKKSVVENTAMTEDEAMPLKACYSYSHKATKYEPYDISEEITLNISGNKVEGRKFGTQAGPDMNNGYEGFLIGTISGKTMEVTYTYVIEGSRNKELEIYEVKSQSLVKKRWPLVQEGGILVPDKTGEVKSITYVKKACPN